MVRTGLGLVFGSGFAFYGWPWFADLAIRSLPAYIYNEGIAEVSASLSQGMGMGSVIAGAYLMGCAGLGLIASAVIAASHQKVVDLRGYRGVEQYATSFRSESDTTAAARTARG